MRDARGVRLGEPPEERTRRPQHLVREEDAPELRGLERHALHELHHEVEAERVVLAEVVHADHVRRLQLRDGERLATKALGRVRV